MPACLFCQIIQGERPSKKVYEDDQVYAFDDVRPQAPVHVLICPKKHIPTINDLLPEDSDLVGHIFQVAKKIAEERGVHQRGYRTLFNVNAGAGQSVYHVHLHLLGGRFFSWPPG